MYSISMGPARPRRDPREVLEEIHRSDTQKVKVAITDIDGILRGKYVHKEKFLSAAQGGFGFCNVVFGWDSSDVCYDDAAYTVRVVVPVPDEEPSGPSDPHADKAIASSSAVSIGARRLMTPPSVSRR